MSLGYLHVDVFSPTPYSGNSLAAFPAAGGLSGEQMLRVTQELRHFESVFLEPTDSPFVVRARVYDLFEELPFAGHPIIGAAAVLHRASGLVGAQTWWVEFSSTTVSVTTEGTEDGYFGLLDQGTPQFLGTVERREDVARAFDLESTDLHPDLPLEVVSTGMRHLIVPVKPGALDRARIHADITGLMQAVGTQFAVLLDESSLEVRHFNFRSALIKMRRRTGRRRVAGVIC